jgi:hypothetical protein
MLVCKTNKVITCLFVCVYNSECDVASSDEEIIENEGGEVSQSERDQQFSHLVSTDMVV